ncbi:protein kinase superfamily protein [Striga asiatica]|uniref:Protein kinase superfamily protein n=1 Tax=Striga asiatica TaxID=4170 RepID=A0A5A7P6C6_STRAF|nr:protein kinase superfamily protein [Striga asiatica]
MTSAGKSRSRVPAPTVVIHGATFFVLYGSGPLFPAEHETRMPLSVAAKAPIKITFSDNDNTWTPSLMAWSIPASMSESKHPGFQQTLYDATRAVDAIPRAVPLAKPSRLAPWTGDPTAVLADLAPTNFLLQLDFGKSIVPSHPPFQLLGMGPSCPSSLKLGCCGNTPVSRTPTTTSLTSWGSGRSELDFSRPRNRGVRVVWSVWIVSGITDITPSRPFIRSASSEVRMVEKPSKTFS